MVSSHHHNIHTGRVKYIYGTVYSVDISSTGSHDCAGCRMAGVCGGGSDSSITVDALSDKNLFPSVGDKVSLIPDQRSTELATILLFVLPLTIMIATMIIMSAANFSDLVTGLSSLLAGGASYILVHLFCKRQKPVWTIIDILN